MRRLTFLPRRRFGPGLLEADIDGSVDDRAAFDFGAREEDELRLVKDALGRYLHLRLFVHT